MTNKNLNLRQRAIEILDEKGLKFTKDQYQDLEKLIEELNIYQIEIDMQNQELQDANYHIEKEKEKFKELYMETPVPYCTLNRTGNIYQINHTAAELFGKPYYSFNKTSIFGFISDKSKTQFTKFIKEAFVKNKNESDEIVIINLKNELINVKIHCKVYYDEEHQTELCRCTLSDITDIKRNQKTINEQKQLINNIVNNIEGFLIRYFLYPDGTDKIDFLSKGIENLYSIPYEEALKNPNLIWDYVLRDDLESIKNAIEKSAKNRSLFKVDYRVINRDKSEKYLRAKGMPEYLPDGSIRWDTLVVDVTTEKKYQEDLLRSENRFKKFFEADKSIKLIIDDKSGNILDANKAAVDFYGYRDVTKENIKNINIFSKEEVAAEMQKAKKFKKNYFQFKHRLASGEIRDVEVYSTPMAINETDVLFSIIHDNTERLQAENELKESNFTKDKFVRLLAHDLKSPFNSLLGLSDYLLEDYDSMTEQERKELVIEMNKVMQNTNNLISNILSWSIIQLGKVDFIPETNNLYELIISEKNLLSNIAKNKNIEIFIEVPSNIQIYADGNMLRTVIRNILSNAIKFTPFSGRVTVSANKTSKRTILAFSDTGVGMDNNTIETLFSGKKTVSNPGTEGETGTGFGLALCKEFVDFHHGNIEVISKQDEGTTFIVKLPIVENFS